MIFDSNKFSSFLSKTWDSLFEFSFLSWITGVVSSAVVGYIAFSIGVAFIGGMLLLAALGTAIWLIGLITSFLSDN